jgi:hypothetical protein
VLIARKHCSNWAWLVIKASLRARGKFRSRQGGSLSCDARKLLKSLVRLETTWRRNGETLPIKFESDHLVIPGYFGRDFRLPLNSADGVAPPSALLNKYPFSVRGEVVLDIGAWLGDTPLMWLYKGAKHVIAVEPVPLHFSYLERNTAGLPVICLKASLAVKLPSIPAVQGNMVKINMSNMMMCRHERRRCCWVGRSWSIFCDLCFYENNIKVVVR